jgi:hypothetical protein
MVGLRMAADFPVVPESGHGACDLAHIRAGRLGPPGTREQQPNRQTSTCSFWAMLSRARHARTRRDSQAKPSGQLPRVLRNRSPVNSPIAARHLNKGSTPACSPTECANNIEPYLKTAKYVESRRAAPAAISRRRGERVIFQCSRNRRFEPDPLVGETLLSGIIAQLCQRRYPCSEAC